jgi:hypothetical protein
LVLLPADLGDSLEVGVVVQDDQAARLGDSSDRGIHEGQGAMLAALGPRGLDLERSAVVGIGRRYGRERRKAVAQARKSPGLRAAYSSSNAIGAVRPTSPSAASGDNAAATVGLVKRAKTLVAAR